jgi:hypothetical protein
MNNLLQDLRFAIRQMLRSPGFAFTAVLTLALGIAANVIVFGVLDSLILRPLDVPHAEQVWQLGTTVLAYPVFSYPEARDIRDGNSVFSAVAGDVGQVFGVESDGNTSVMWGLEAGGQYFDVLGIKPALGRLLQRSDDDHPGASDAAVISWGAWKGKFGGDPKIVGKLVRINKQPYTIVGSRFLRRRSDGCWCFWRAAQCWASCWGWRRAGCSRPWSIRPRHRTRW